MIGRDIIFKEVPNQVEQLSSVEKVNKYTEVVVSNESSSADEIDSEDEANSGDANVSTIDLTADTSNESISTTHLMMIGMMIQRGHHPTMMNWIPHTKVFPQ